eukprot:5260784-Alexandrium_andersonii.AAC.1
MDILNPGTKQWIDAGVHGADLGAFVNMLKVGMNTHYSKGRSHRCQHHFVLDIHPTVVDGKEQTGVR